MKYTLRSCQPVTENIDETITKVQQKRYVPKVAAKRKFHIWAPRVLMQKNDGIEFPFAELCRNEIKPFLKQLIMDDKKRIKYEMNVQILRHNVR